MWGGGAPANTLYREVRRVVAISVLRRASGAVRAERNGLAAWFPPLRAGTMPTRGKIRGKGGG